MTQPLQALFFRNLENDHIADILEEIYLRKVYEPHLLGKKDLIIVDVGANQGLTSYYFKDYAKQVYAIEPSSLHLEALNKMIAENKITNITVCPYAISNENGKTKFYHNPNPTMFSLNQAVNQQGDDFEEVETVTFDEFMKRNNLDHVDLLKLDVEGFEAEIIASDEFKKWSSNINVVTGEWHSWAKVERNQFANMFRDLGYNFRWTIGTKAACFTAVRV